MLQSASGGMLKSHCAWALDGNDAVSASDAASAVVEVRLVIPGCMVLIQEEGVTGHAASPIIGTRVPCHRPTW
jgi:hypothetical protein